MNIYKRILFALLLLSGCSDDDNDRRNIPQWRKLGLDGKSINEIKLHGSDLYVATTTGLYKREGNSGNANFQLLGFEGKNVEAIELVATSIIVSIYDKSGAEPPALFTTSDDGDNWLPLQNNFGGNSPEPVFDLEVHPENEEVWYATGFSLVAKSTNSGETWQPVYGDWGGFATGISVVEINANDAAEVWAGGQGAIENGFLLRTKNEDDWDTWSDLVENPTVVKEITFVDGAKESVFVGFEGALLKTQDGGQHWETLIDSEDNRFFFGVGIGSAIADRIYAGGWLKTNAQQPLILYVSDNGGDTFAELKFSPEAFGGILELQVKSREGKDIVYIGLDKGGVYEVTFPH